MQLPRNLSYLIDDDDDMHVYDESDSDNGSVLSTGDASDSDVEILDDTASSDLLVQLQSQERWSCRTAHEDKQSLQCSGIHGLIE